MMRFGPSRRNGGAGAESQHHCAGQGPDSWPGTRNGGTAGWPGAAARSALAAGAPVLCDSVMVAGGITRSRLRAGNPVVCTLTDLQVPERAARLRTTRSAAAIDQWRDRLDGAVVLSGNAPTALFRLLELLESGAPSPAVIIGILVGFVGAAESKAALASRSGGVTYLIVHGRRGGSAMTAAAVNALAGDPE